jgi:uncharacterized membrane protein
VTAGSTELAAPLAALRRRFTFPVTYAAVVVPIVAAVFILGGLAFKSPCLATQHGQQFSGGCYNDMQYLWGIRDLSGHAFPYVHGGLHGDTFPAGTVEYPVLTGLFIWLSALLVPNANWFLVVSALLLLPFGVLAARGLAKLTGWRALYFAAAPSLVLYSAHNWDLLVVAAVVAAFTAWSRGRHGWAAFWLGIGASLKFFPLFFFAPLLAERAVARDGRGALRVLGAGIGTIVVVNLPFVIASPAGWWSPYAFQRLRNADFTSDSVWAWGASTVTLHELNHLVPGLIAISFVIALLLGWWRARRDGVYPFIQVCAAMLLAFVLWNKAFSPQYALWILPFFALIRLRWGWWLAFVAVDLLLYFGLFRWYFDVEFRHYDFTTLALANQAIIVGIWARAVLVGVLFFVVLFSASAVSPPPRARAPAA